MMILTNGLTDVVDEGFLKVANSLVKRLKKSDSDIEVVSYERHSALSDIHINVNKFMLSKSLLKLCKKHRDVLYIPFPTKKFVMALRVFLLSKSVDRLRVVLVLKTPLSFISRLMLKLSKAEIVVFSKEASDFYSAIVGNKRVVYLKTGIDTNKFRPVSAEKSAELKIKYGFESDKKTVLHVGHLNEGRNIRELMKISKKYQVLLVTSTLTKNEQDEELKQQLLSVGNIRIIDDFIPDIQEIYQLSDVYFFPVLDCGHCIDVPLSCLEASASGKPVVTTHYGEMREFVGKNGFYFIDSFEAEAINRLIDSAVDGGCNDGSAVAEYDWHFASSFISDN